MLLCLGQHHAVHIAEGEEIGDQAGGPSDRHGRAALANRDERQRLIGEPLRRPLIALLVTPAEVAAWLPGEVAKWAGVIKAAGVTVD